jgi:enamine deaminase RidA (YjgF/YER057c/UK114 family)
VPSEVTRISPDPDPIADRFGFHQGILVAGASRLLFLSGQVGTPGDDLADQVRTALRRMRALLVQADMDVTDLRKLTILTTDVEALLAVWPVVRVAFEPEPVPPNTLAQVQRFAHPGALVEIDAIATR